jgi:hypothetical protein
VHDAWREYKRGIDGRPSVESEEKRERNRYCANDTEKRFFRRRRIIWGQIKAIAGRLGVPEDEAVNRLQACCIMEGEAKSLNWLHDRIVNVKNGKEQWTGSGPNLFG